MVENLDGLPVKILTMHFTFVIFLIKNILIALFSISIALPNVPKTLEGQRNQTKVTSQNTFFKIEKANISYVFGPKEDKVVSVNFDKKNILISKTNYKISNKTNVFLIQDDCLNIDCYHFIHK